MTRKACCLVLLWLAWCPRLEAAPKVQFFGRTLQPLLYVTSKESMDFGANWSNRQIYIFRNGTVLVSLLGEHHDSIVPTGGAVSSGQAFPAAMRALKAALAGARAGSMTDCSIDPPDAPLEWYFTLTWFGAGDRKNRFKVTQDSDVGPRCALQVDELIFAIQEVVSSAQSAASTRLSTF